MRILNSKFIEGWRVDFIRAGQSKLISSLSLFEKLVGKCILMWWNNCSVGIMKTNPIIGIPNVMGALVPFFGLNWKSLVHTSKYEDIHFRKLFQKESLFSIINNDKNNKSSLSLSINTWRMGKSSNFWGFLVSIFLALLMINFICFCANTNIYIV